MAAWTEDIGAARRHANKWWYENKAKNTRWLKTRYRSYEDYLAEQKKPEFLERYVPDERVTEPELSEFVEDLDEFYRSYEIVRLSDRIVEI